MFGSHGHCPSLGIQAERTNRYYTCYWSSALVSEEAKVPWWWAKLQRPEVTGLFAWSRKVVCFEGLLVSSRGNRNEEDKAEVSQRKSGCKMTKQCCCERVHYCSNSPCCHAPPPCPLIADLQQTLVLQAAEIWSRKPLASLGSTYGPGSFSQC